MANTIRLDRAGIAQMLNSAPVAAATVALGSSVAGGVNATAGGEPIKVRTRTRTASGGGLSPRTAFDISLAHPAGLRVEAKRAPLARAAASRGLEVKGRAK